MWTRRVPHPVLIGHAASLSQVSGFLAARSPGARPLLPGWGPRWYGRGTRRRTNGKSCLDPSECPIYLWRKDPTECPIYMWTLWSYRLDTLVL